MIREDMFLLIAREGEYDPNQDYSKNLGLYKINVSEQSFEFVKTVPIVNQAFYNNCFDCVLPDLSKVSMMEGNLEHFSIYDTGTQTLTDFEMIGLPDTFATWTPDGKNLVYMTQMRDDQLCLIKVSVDGDDIQSRVVFCPELQALSSERMYHHSTELHWSPDGKYLAIEASANFYQSQIGDTQTYENYLYVVRMKSDPLESIKGVPGIVGWLK